MNPCLCSQRVLLAPSLLQFELSPEVVEVVLETGVRGSGGGGGWWRWRRGSGSVAGGDGLLLRQHHVGLPVDLWKGETLVRAASEVSWVLGESTLILDIDTGTTGAIWESARGSRKGRHPPPSQEELTRAFVDLEGAWSFNRREARKWGLRSDRSLGLTLTMLAGEAAGSLGSVCFLGCRREAASVVCGVVAGVCCCNCRAASCQTSLLFCITQSTG